MRTLEVMRHVDRSRFQMDFLVTSGAKGQLDGEIQALGGKVIPCSLKSVGFPARFGAIVRSGGYTVVHSHLHLFSGFILMLAARQRIPVRIAHFRSMGDAHQDGLLRNAQRALMRRLLDQYATDILAVSEGALVGSWRADWRNDPRCRVVYNGLDITAYRSPPDRAGVCAEFGLPLDARVCVHVGRFCEAKNQGRLASIFVELADMQPDAYLLLVGKPGGREEELARGTVNAAGLQDRVVFTGERSDVSRILCAADLAFLPSRREGLPGAVLEACAAGIPVIASDLPGCQEIATHFELVRCLPLAQPDRVWAEAARDALMSHQPDRAAALARFDASPFSLETCAQAMTGIWEKGTTE
ncbi:MAG: glycosyltransferase [Armatimonadetes bacterium]|nr:glycosyltransferase [Armatimonadota bacterium]